MLPLLLFVRLPRLSLEASSHIQLIITALCNHHFYLKHEFQCRPLKAMLELFLLLLHAKYYHPPDELPRFPQGVTIKLYFVDPPNLSQKS